MESAIYINQSLDSTIEINQWINQWIKLTNEQTTMLQSEPMDGSRFVKQTNQRSTLFKKRTDHWTILLRNKPINE